MFPAETNLLVLREAIRFAEKSLDAQLAIITALAQRAAGLATMLGAAAAATLTVEVTILNAFHDAPTLRLFILAAIAPLLMLAGCAYCGKAAATSTFQTAGNYPASWKGNVTEADLNDALAGELDNYQEYLVHNDGIIASHAGYLQTGLRLGFGSLAVLMLVGAAFFYVHR
ncbi:MAG: hypothetical protein ACHQK9_15195 [Reyranellales bacterium]